MRFKGRYLVIIEATTSEMSRFYDYLQYQVNFVMVDAQAFMIDSWMTPDELTEHFRTNISRSAKCFVCEVTGQMTWRNIQCGTREMNKFLSKSLA